MDTYNLEFDSLTVDVDGSDFEVDSDGWHELFLEDIVSESHQERRLSDSGVSDKQDFEKVIAINTNFG